MGFFDSVGICVCTSSEMAKGSLAPPAVPKATPEPEGKLSKLAPLSLGYSIPPTFVVPEPGPGEPIDRKGRHGTNETKKERSED